MRPVQSCIAHVGFATSFAEFPGMFAANEHTTADWPVDLVTLLAQQGQADYWWSAPRWVVGGDIMWMYHTRKGAEAVRRLRRQFDGNPDWAADIAECTTDLLDDMLADVGVLSAEFERAIFACAEVGNSAAKFEDAAPGKHHVGRMFAPINRVHRLTTPISLDEFSAAVKLATGGAYTAVGSGEFDALKRIVESRNTLPGWARDTKGGDLGFRDITTRNWWDRVCRPGVRFLHEKQVRWYFIDHLLDALRDPGTPVLEECACVRAGRPTGTADYMVRIGGRWTPVEAKFDVGHERNIGHQIAKYVDADAFRPTQGKDMLGDLVRGPTASRCLVVDRAGAYVATASGLVIGGRDAPTWRRETLGRQAVNEIRGCLARA